MKRFLLPLDLLYLSFDTLRAIIQWVRPGTSRACVHCRTRTSYGDLRPVRPAKKYHNLFVFRLLCPFVQEDVVPETSTTQRQCHRKNIQGWSRVRLGLSALVCVVFWSGVLVPLVIYQLPQRAQARVAMMVEQRNQTRADSQAKQELLDNQFLATAAFAAAQSGPVEERIRNLETAVLKDPGHAAARNQLIHHLIQGVRIERAWFHIEQTRFRDPDNVALDLQTAEIEVVQARYPEAVKRLDSIRPRIAGEAELLLSAGATYLQAGQATSARECLEAAASLIPDHPDALRNLARIALRDDRIDEAAALLQRIPKEQQALAATRAVKADLQMHRNAPQKAIDLLMESLKPEGAEVDIDTAFQLCALLVNLQREDEVRKIAESLSASTNPVNRQTGQGILSELFLKKGLYARAIAAADQVLNENPHQARAVMTKARAYYLQGDFAQAEHAVDDLDPGYRDAPNVKHLLARCRMNQSATRDDRSKLEQAVAEHPDNLQIMIELAHMHHQAKRFDKAREVYEAFLKKHPGNAICANNLANLLADEGRDLDRAESLARRNAEREPGNAFYADTLGWILVRRGKAEAARPYLEHTVRFFPRSPEARWHLARALHQLGDNPAALRELDVALELSADFLGAEEAHILRTTLQKDLP